jgi:hypothetical protein
MRPLEALISTEENAWPLVQEWIANASNPVEVLVTDMERRRSALHRLQVTTRSAMGAIAFETGGILVDGGWLRILGAGCSRLSRSIPDWNERVISSPAGQPPPLLLIADDILGGFFAINGGGLPGRPGEVLYFAPDSLEWEELSSSYSDFLAFAFSGDLELFYRDYRWPSCRDEVASLNGDQGISIYPFLWADGPPVGERTRATVPIHELWSLQRSFLRQMGGAG